MYRRWIVGVFLWAFAVQVWAISPYIQGDSVPPGNIQSVASAVELRLRNEGFKVVGRYLPRNLPGQGVVIFTDDAMLSEIGAAGGHAILGAAMRVGIKADGSVAYTNPDYWYRAYFRRGFDKRDDAVRAMQARLASALGAGKGLGGDEPSGNLAHYRYMIGMERLDSYKNKLTEYGSFAEALKAVRENLAKGTAKTSKVYEIVLPERRLAVFGVAMHDPEMGDSEWIRRIEMQDNLAALPYEIYIVDKSVESPHARYRIALSFPDVGMGQFMRISSVPSFIIETMSSVAGIDKKAGNEAWQ